MKEFNLTEREEEIMQSDDWSQFSNEELGALFRKDNERLKYLRRGEYEKECRTQQASIALNIINQLSKDCDVLTKQAKRNADKIDISKLRSRFENMEMDFKSAFNSFGRFAGWYKDEKSKL